MECVHHTQIALITHRSSDQKLTINTCANKQNSKQLYWPRAVQIAITVSLATFRPSSPSSSWDRTTRGPSRPHPHILRRMT